MIPRTAIAQIAEKIGRELNSGAQPSGEALAAGPIMAEAGATPEIVGRLFAEAQRNRRNDRMIDAYAFMLEGALARWLPRVRNRSLIHRPILAA